ncbi:MAG: proline dehydrogenase [Ignavibacteria bacterium]
MHLLNTFVVRTLPLVPQRIVRYFAGRYIAGEILDDAIRCVRQINKEGACATLDVLGEDVIREEEAMKSRERSIEVLRAITRERIDSNLSIKLTSLGLKLSKELCTHNTREILKAAAEENIFVRFDMEDSSCTTDTIDIFRTLHKEFSNCGIVLQAYLYRTEHDARALMAEGMKNFRLCKGIYKEPASIAYQKRDEVQRNFLKVLRVMFEGKAYVGIATHDSVLVDGAKAMVEEFGLRKNEYEFQMLLGVCPELRKALVNEGHKVRLYVPFGESWYAYSMRRFKENPEIAGYVARAVFMRNK